MMSAANYANCNAKTREVELKIAEAEGSDV
jgi:hypothetical protein